MKNIQLELLIKELRKNAIEHNVNIWRRVAADLEKPTRSRRIVNLYKLNNFASENEILLVPGKVLGLGELNKKVIVAAYQFSAKAKRAIEKNGGEALSILDLVKKNPKGKGVRIIG